MREHGAVTEQTEMIVHIEVAVPVRELPGDLIDFFLVLGQVCVHPGIRILRGQTAGGFELSCAGR